MAVLSRRRLTPRLVPRRPDCAASRVTEPPAGGRAGGRSFQDFSTEVRKAERLMAPGGNSSLISAKTEKAAREVLEGKNGYLLLWVILGSNVMASVIRTITAKLWIAMEVGAMASDLTGFIGAKEPLAGGAPVQTRKAQPPTAYRFTFLVVVSASRSRSTVTLEMRW